MPIRRCVPSSTVSGAYGSGPDILEAAGRRRHHQKLYLYIHVRVVERLSWYFRRVEKTGAGAPAELLAIINARPLIFCPRWLGRADRKSMVAFMTARQVQLALLFGSRFVQSIMRMCVGPLVIYICEDTAKGRP